MPTEKEPATIPNEVMLTLTKEQQDQIKKQTGKLINVLKLTPQELEERASTYLAELQFAAADSW